MIVREGGRDDPGLKLWHLIVMAIAFKRATIGYPFQVPSSIQFSVLKGFCCCKFVNKLCYSTVVGICFVDSGLLLSFHINVHHIRYFLQYVLFMNSGYV